MRLPRWTVIWTVVPGLPRISPEANWDERPASRVEFTCTISSALSRPALAAGEFGNTSMILSPCLIGSTLTPIPAKCGLDSFKNVR